MKKLILASLITASCTLNVAHAALLGFVSNPTSNSLVWTTQVSSLSGSINSNINFDGMATGALNGSFYTGSDGVTLIASGDVNTIVFGPGPANGNIFSTPLSPGEGLNAASNYLFDGGSPSSLTISFNSPVLGVGLDIVDYFNPSDNNPLTIEAFTGQNGTGISLGLLSSLALNFQDNNTYFMGLISTNNDIGSLVFTDVNSVTGDTTGIDNIVFATSGSQNVPEPATIALLALGFAGISFSRRKKIL